MEESKVIDFNKIPCGDVNSHNLAFRDCLREWLALPESDKSKYTLVPAKLCPYCGESLVVKYSVYEDIDSYRTINGHKCPLCDHNEKEEFGKTVYIPRELYNESPEVYGNLLCFEKLLTPDEIFERDRLAKEYQIEEKMRIDKAVEEARLANTARKKHKIDAALAQINKRNERRRAEKAELLQQKAKQEKIIAENRGLLKFKIRKAAKKRIAEIERKLSKY